MNPPPVPVPDLRADRRRGLHALTLPVLGIPVRFETHAREVLDAVADAFGRGDAAERDAGWADEEPVRVRIRLRSGDADGHAPAPLRQRWSGDRLWVRAGESRGMADLARRRAWARVTAGLVRDRERFRDGVLHALTLWMLTALDRQPLHAAGLERDGAVLLLAGPSGVGKSTLVYAALRDGLRVLAEDCVYLQEGIAPRVWGIPGRVHLLPDALRWFPELADTEPSLRANGKTKRSVRVPQAGMAPPSRGMDRAGVCLLARGPSPGIERLSPRAVEAGLTARFEPGFHRFAHTIGVPVRRLAARGGWRLTLPASPLDAVPILHRLLDEL